MLCTLSLFYWEYSLQQVLSVLEIQSALFPGFGNWILFIYLCFVKKKKKKKKKKSFKPFNRSPVLFSRIKWPQLPALSWTTSSQSSTSSQQCSHLGTALCPGTICCPLPLPPGGRQSTAARLWCSHKTELWSARHDVTCPLHGGGGAV